MSDPKETEVVVGNIRVQALSETLLRIERKGPKGFEDRPTFTVACREWPGSGIRRVRAGSRVFLRTAGYQVSIPAKGQSLAGIRVLSPQNKVLHVFRDDPVAAQFLPAPSKMPAAWVMPDCPRVIPPPWGATPAPRGIARDARSGWDVGNDAPDVYVFLPGAGGYEQLRRDFLRLTGPIPMPPLYVFGLMHSRYHAYSEKTALKVIDSYRKKRIPLDMFVLDTDWRIGASHGYAINRRLFPDMKRFLKEAHKRGVMVMFNDHPEPVGDSALDPRELKHRFDELTGLMRLGVDAWWYDRNWNVHLHEPAPGLHKEVWGMRLFHDITQRFRPGRRPLIMSNVHGIDHGKRRHAPHPASHRYPVWWTGDTRARWNYLHLGIRNAVDGGLLSLLPYMSEDLGGHQETPTPELYLRFIQFGMLSPIARPHCTQGQRRYPWAFGTGIEKMAAEYIRLRYRLLPVIYNAARQAWEDGTPLLRRCDLYWPEHEKAAGSYQYLLGNDLLVAPVSKPAGTGRRPALSSRTVWIPPGTWRDAWTGSLLRGPRIIRVSSELWHTPIYIREGGVLLTLPEVQRAHATPWRTVIVNAYADCRECATTRLLYEDDGISCDYEGGKCCTTPVSLRVGSGRISLTIDRMKGRYRGSLGGRSWILRLQLPVSGQLPEVITLNGRPVSVAATPRAKSPIRTRLLHPLAETRRSLFAGEGSRPQPESGPVLEVVVRGFSTRKKLEMVLDY